MRRNKYDIQSVGPVEDQRPSWLESLFQGISPYTEGVTAQEDPENHRRIQAELERMEQIRKLQIMHDKRREGILKEREEGTRPLRKFGHPGIFDSWDSYLMNTPDRDNQGRPLR